MSFNTYLKAVGTGPKGNRDLSFDESYDMMQHILKQDIYSEQISAFLLGWRLKPETIEEFQGALSACESFLKKEHIENSILLGYPFDGKAKNPYLLPHVASLLKKEDLNLVVVGDDVQPAKKGVTIQDIFPHVTCHANTTYFERKECFKELHNLTQIRTRLGLRSGFNTIEKLLNFAESEYAITGVFHKPYVKKYKEIFADKYKRFALIQGNEGGPEIFKKGTLWITENNITKEYIVDPAYYGVHREKSTENFSLADSVEHIKNPSKECLQLAKINAAVYLFVSNKAKSIDEAYERLRY
ncbi:glycosyl transferase [Sulfurimonas sp. SAG-AH-194-I05]|nr:glycosyl transferase [Sulfurimonas sp. SAG-AH-194-I05]MDF1875427.1 glycosyl transferase [Sulfurimonas sp. SAG-AH-194-I05]